MDADLQPSRPTKDSCSVVACHSQMTADATKDGSFVCSIIATVSEMLHSDASEQITAREIHYGTYAKMVKKWCRILSEGDSLADI